MVNNEERLVQSGHEQIPTIINFFPFEIDHVSMTVRMAVAVKRTFITMAAAAIGS